MSAATDKTMPPSAVKAQHEYYWNLAYRLDHWIRVAALVVLTLTGFYIHWPFITETEYAPHCWPVMAWMRFGHFVAGYVFLLGLVVRVYLAFFSRFDADWRDFGIWRNLKNVPDMILYYLFLRRSHQPYRRYNPLQALTYLFWAGLIVAQTLTGLALYRGSLFAVLPCPESFAWVSRLLGSEAHTRLVHHLIMWIFIITGCVHVYMAAMVAWTRRDRSFRAMFTGYRLQRPEEE